jgi:hypothetical protein
LVFFVVFIVDFPFCVLGDFIGGLGLPASPAGLPAATGADPVAVVSPAAMRVVSDSAVELVPDVRTCVLESRRSAQPISAPRAVATAVVMGS